MEAHNLNKNGCLMPYYYYFRGTFVVTMQRLKILMANSTATKKIVQCTIAPDFFLYYNRFQVKIHNYGIIHNEA